jgi:catechol 2,3-dioxygenase-like lactoylglutathione lyase family enzyme
MNDVATAGRRLAAEAERIVPGKLAHFVLKTARFDAMIDWYRTVLQARVALRTDMLCFLTYDEEHHRVAFINVPESAAAEPHAAGVHHVAFTYRGLGDLLATYRRLAAAGIRPYWCINHGPTTSMYYRDPDGLSIELQVDNFASDSELNDYFSGPDFAANPIGVIYDPDDLVRRYEAGEAMDALLRRPALPPGKTPMDMLVM